MSALHKSGKLKKPEERGDLLTKASEKLVLLDSMEYINLLPEISPALAACLGEVSAAKTIARITKEIEVKSLDDKTRNSIKKIFNSGAKRCEKIGNYDGMKQYLRSKWTLFGINSKDIDFASSKFGQLMKLGRPEYALEQVIDMSKGFANDQVEYKLGIALQTFKNLSGAVITEREEFNGVVTASKDLFDITVSSVESEKLLSDNEVAAMMSTNLLSSTVSLMDRVIKKSGKSVTPEAVYPLLHESMKPLVLDIIEVIGRIGIQKPKKTASNTISKISGESVHKDEMMKPIESLK
jgi:hypothetical protein